jgi:hypothetical protein
VTGSYKQGNEPSEFHRIWGIFALAEQEKRADFVCVLLGDGGLLLCSGGVFFLVSYGSVSW